MNYKQQKRFIIGFLCIYAFEFIVNNLAHPMTPLIIKNLKLGDYMFGLAFAAMASTNFLFSPLWGKLTKNVRLSTLMGIGCIGYALGQTIFMLAVNEWMVVAARLFSGIFAGGYTVVSMIVVVDCAPEGTQGKFLTWLTTITVVAGAFGYLAGGVLGDISVKLCFMVQIVGMILCGILFMLYLRKGEPVPDAPKGEGTMRVMVKEANPFSAFFSIRPLMTGALAVLFCAVLCAFVALNAFEQCFNYYMIDQFNFSTAYNGAVKAGTGIVALVANMTVCMAILRRKKIDFPTAVLLGGCGLLTALMLQMPGLGTFLGVAMVFFGCTSVFQPLLQEQVAVFGRGAGGSGVVMGFYNAVKSLGMIIGALVAGFIYDIRAELPFWMAAVFFGLACGFSFLYIRMRRKKS